MVVFPHTLEFVRADKNDADVVAIAYKKHSFVCFCVSAFVSWKKQAAAALLMRTLSRVFISDYVDVFPKEKNSANLFRVLLIP